MTVYIGIDPGLNGAVGQLWEGHTFVYRTPTITVKKRHQCDVQEMTRTLRRCLEHSSEVFAVLEAAHARPGQGVVSMFSFGMGYGMWQGILAALGIPYQLVSPQAWKKVLLRDTDKSKGAAKLVASRLWPTLGKLTDGEAEALLLAEFGRRLKFSIWEGQKGERGWLTGASSHG